MKQTELDRAVAKATGESVSTIKRLGFVLADPRLEPTEVDSADNGPRVLDWDEMDIQRHLDPAELFCQ